MNFIQKCTGLVLAWAVSLTFAATCAAQAYNWDGLYVGLNVNHVFDGKAA